MIPPLDGRAEVLAWMAETGSGYRVAAKRFGLHEETVKSWVRRAKTMGAAAKADAPQDVGAPETAPKVTVAPKKPRQEREKPRESRAREPAPTAPGSSPEAGAPQAAPTGAAKPLAEDVRDSLRDTVQQLCTFLREQSLKASRGEKVDMRAVADASRSLDVLLERSTDLLAVDTKTKPTQAADTGKVRSRIEAVFGKPAPKLREISGGRAETA